MYSRQLNETDIVLADLPVVADGDVVPPQSKAEATSPVLESSTALRRRSSSAQVTANSTNTLSRTVTDDWRMSTVLQQTDVKVGFVDHCSQSVIR